MEPDNDPGTVIGNLILYTIAAALVIVILLLLVSLL
jgi:hypothetical protein